LTFPEIQLENLPGSEMIFPDNLLVLLEKRVVSRSKSDKGLIPVPSSVHLATIGRTLLGELNNRFFNEFLWMCGERKFLHHFAPSCREYDVVDLSWIEVEVKPFFPMVR
jgi:hypothetical protein